MGFSSPPPEDVHDDEDGAPSCVATRLLKADGLAFPQSGPITLRSVSPLGNSLQDWLENLDSGREYVLGHVFNDCMSLKALSLRLPVRFLPCRLVPISL